MSNLSAFGPYSDDVYLPPGMVDFLPRGGTVDHSRGHHYVSLRDDGGVERALAAYFIGPDGHGYRVRQSVTYGDGNPVDPDTERIPETLDSEVIDLGEMNADQLASVMASDCPQLRR
ncbi:hypothetical protein H7J07_05315 [Mycobacterium koreense]|uniref:Uncharacterized protein n=1 Tax=Mycolicibacillus koreensis TaxID=1069220 RepID=A0A7I7SDH8_9MYCO|nr:hypothetical protein [Mycolicibacillus koreensis]MCV7247643.1 hypothetical protein [Mycolicibacillus koreensis]OSC30602.1 hypothetical protein B8W67_16835 [Mycolicibacillus koreensis]BBY54025.1 hypothetical protein MKOR_12760 [Mycolicibacillus koreensis]